MYDDSNVYSLVGCDAVFKLERAFPLSHPDGGSHIPKLEIRINGKDLFQVLELSNKDMDLISVIGGAAYPESDYQKLGALLNEADSGLPGGRVHLLGCPLCGSPGCGGISVSIHETSEFFVWSDFGWTNIEEDSSGDDSVFSSAGPYRFRKEEYELQIRRHMT